MSARVLSHVAVALAFAVAAPHARAAGRIEVRRSHATIAGAPFVISGSLSADPLAADFTAYTPRWRIGGLALREVVLRVRARRGGVQACLAGDAFGSRLVACGMLPHPLDHLDRLGTIDVTWRLAGAGANGQGSARLAWRAGAVRIERGRFELAAPARVAGAELDDATIAGELSGSLAPLDLHVTARARAGAVAIAGVALANVELPLDARVNARGARVERATLAVLGAALALDPFDLRGGAPIDTTLHVRGLPLGKMLALASDGRLEGTGMLDGELALHVGDDGATLSRGALRARTGGGFRVRDAGWATRMTASLSGVEVHRRIENALSDFAYDRLALVVRPAGTGPDATLVLHGRGKRVAQELSITVNLRGVRDTARSLLARYPSLGVP